MDSYFEKKVKNKISKIVKADLNSPCRELSKRGLGIIVALSVFSGIIFRVFLLGVQSSCTKVQAITSTNT